MVSSNDGVSIGTSVVAGAAAFLVGVVLTILLVAVGVIGGGFFSGAPIRFGVLAYVSYHLWPVLLGGSPSSQSLVFTLLPVVLTVGAGYVAASTAGRGGGGFGGGASVAAGYFIPSTLAFLFVLLMVGRLAGPILDLVVGLAVTGLVFPAVFGGIGGALAG